MSTRWAIRQSCVTHRICVFVRSSVNTDCTMCSIMGRSPIVKHPIVTMGSTHLAMGSPGPHSATMGSLAEVHYGGPRDLDVFVQKDAQGKPIVDPNPIVDSSSRCLPPPYVRRLLLCCALPHDLMPSARAHCSNLHRTPIVCAAMCVGRLTIVLKSFKLSARAGSDLFRRPA